MAKPNNQVYTLMYNDVNLYRYEMTRMEARFCAQFVTESLSKFSKLGLLKEQDHRGRVIDVSFITKRSGDDELYFAFKTDIGFFHIYTERGMCKLLDGFPDKDPVRVYCILLDRAASTIGISLELKFRELLIEKWHTKYDVEYDSRLYAFEYVIKKFLESNSVLTDEIIATYSRLMNLWFKTPHWRYDRESLRFVEIV